MTPSETLESINFYSQEDMTDGEYEAIQDIMFNGMLNDCEGLNAILDAVDVDRATLLNLVCITGPTSNYRHKLPAWYTLEAKARAKAIAEGHPRLFIPPDDSPESHAFGIFAINLMASMQGIEKKEETNEAQ